MRETQEPPPPLCPASHAPVLTAQTATNVPTGAPENHTKSRCLGSGPSSGTYGSRISAKWLLPGLLASLGVMYLPPRASVSKAINYMASACPSRVAGIPVGSRRRWD